MSILPWRTKKQLFFLFLVLFAVILIFSVIVYFSWPESSCFDGKQNQEEEGIDCGGPCGPCVVNPKEIVTLWTRVFPVSEGIYEVATMLENPNLYYGISLFKYTFKVYDSSNVLVGIKEGETFLNPRDKYVVFVSDVNTGFRKAVRAFVEIEPITNWQYLKLDASPLIVSNKTFTNTPYPLLKAFVVNQSLFSIENVSAVAVLYDEDHNAVAVSSTALESIKGESGKEIVFTWPLPFEKTPATTEIFTRANFFNHNHD